MGPPARPVLRSVPQSSRESDLKLVQFRGCFLPPALRSVAPGARPAPAWARPWMHSVTPAGPMAASPPSGPPGSRCGRAEPAVHTARPGWAESGTWCRPHPIPSEQGDKLPPRKLRLVIWFPIMLVGSVPGPVPVACPRPCAHSPPPPLCPHSSPAPVPGARSPPAPQRPQPAHPCARRPSLAVSCRIHVQGHVWFSS